MSETKVKGDKSKRQNKKKEKVPDKKVDEEYLRRRRILCQLSRAPGICPLGNCEQVVFPSGLLVHLLHKHGHEPTKMIYIVYDDQPLRLKFKLDDLELDVPQAMAILLYAGTENKKETLPARRHLSFPNSGLLNERRCYEHHLTMVLMICRSTWTAMLPDQELATELEENDVPNNTIYIIWLVSPVTTNRMLYTMTLFDRFYIQSRGVIRNTRNYIASQNPRDFLSLESDYLLLRHEDALDLMGEKENTGHDVDLPEGIRLELFLHEDLSANFVESRISRHVLDTYNGHGAKMPRNKMNLDRDAQGKLFLNRKPLSVPTIASPKASSPEMESIQPEEAKKNTIDDQSKELAPKVSKEKTKARKKAKPLRGHSSELIVDKDLIKSLVTDQKKVYKKELELSQEVNPKDDKEENDNCQNKLEAKWSNYVIALKRRKAKAKKLKKTMEKYLQTCQEENSSLSNLEDTLREFAKADPDQLLADKGKKKRKSISPERHPRKSKQVCPEEPTGSRMKAGSSRAVTMESIEEITAIPMRELQESIWNLQIPITKEVLETVKEAVIKSVKEAVIKVAQKTENLQPEFELEEQEMRKPALESQSKPETQPEMQGKTKTVTETEMTPENLAKILGVAIESVSVTDCDSGSETCAP
ncbi:uncharacterized protein LOC119557342 [Drosophila subpulchrella]|uniref:uncharacterized protein LOC119557342 n=1 Tax=Drosophila subpulchrella TaxID=1486046 RepID=UPI0018A195F1|nr:uncharacterized protein LOC119557342 [Drosophila subpulchrella]